MGDLDWLTARPVAHRGLHDAQEGIIENTPSAFIAAINAGYAIECDLQISSDGEAMVYHDATLGRLTACNARLDTMTAAALKRVAFGASRDRMITLGELCELTAGASERTARWITARLYVRMRAYGARSLPAEPVVAGAVRPIPVEV